MNLLSFAPVLLTLAVTPAIADDGGTIVRLSPADIAAAQAAGGAKHTADAAVDDDIVRPKHQIHGEVGFGVNSRGGREVYGTVVTPIGDSGYAAFSFADGTYGNYGNYWRRGR